MKRRVTEFRLKIVAFALLILCLNTGEHQAQSTEVRAPVLMWKDGGCLAGPKCQTGWYSSPAVVDLDRDGQADVVWGAYDVVAVNGANGNLKWRAASADRVWLGVAIADLTGDGTPEVVVGRSSDRLTVYDRLGNAIWTRSPFGSGEIRTRDGVKELFAHVLRIEVTGRKNPASTFIQIIVDAFDITP